MNLTKFVLGNIAARSIGLVLPPYWLFNQPVVGQVNSAEFDELMALPEEELEDIVRTNALGVPMRMPLSMGETADDLYLLPVEPLVSITGRNIITRRQVAKGNARGSIKERWMQDDYSIKISGVLMSYKENRYPREDVEKLRRLCEASSLVVECPLFEVFSINRIVVENYSFPFTSGLQNQAYEISAYSDDIYKLLIKNNQANTL